MEGTLSLAEVARYPRPGASLPGQITFSPDSRAVYYLFSTAGTLMQGLWRYDLDSGEHYEVVAPQPDAGTRSLDEELRRERLRQRAHGVTSFALAVGGETEHPLVLVPQDGRLSISRNGGPLTPLVGSDGAEAPGLSPDGAQVAFVRDGDLYVQATSGETLPRRLTTSATDGVTNGLAEYIAQEEMGRQEGYWWSPDGTRLAFVHADSRAIPLYPIGHQGKDTFFVEEHRYPFAGGQNAAVRLGILSVADPDAVTWMELGGEDLYLARVAWRPNGTLTATVQSRDQRHLRLLAFAADGAVTTLLDEHGEPWINLNEATRFLHSGEYLVASERHGFAHLYLYEPDGQSVRALTGGDWMVTALLGVDEQRRIAYIQGTADGVLQRHLYAVPLGGGALWRLSDGDGWHEAVMAPDQRHYVDIWSRRDHAPVVTLRHVDDPAMATTLYSNEGNDAATLGLLVPELFSFSNRVGVELYGAVYASEAVRSGREPRPLVVAVYGGPGAQTVTDSWASTVDLRAQYLAQQGYVVLKVDNRGSANRGLAFEAALAGDMGRHEVEDQVDGVRHLAARPYVDGTRVAIYGWSYGGYMTCSALMRAPEVFSVGIAGAPVTSWDGYDSHYTERYMGHPAANTEGYHDSAVLSHVGELRGKLLLIHGMVDENVHFRHTARLIAALTEAGKPYDLLVFPEERHMPRDAQGLEYQEVRLADYLQRHL